MARHGIVPAGRPLVLAVEYSSLCGSVALVTPTCCLAEHSLLSRRTHSHRLLPAIARLMEEAEVGWDDIDGIAVSRGPGSFTGLRIGISTAQGLAMAAAKPLVGIPTPDGLALPLAWQELPVCVVIDARKRQVFTTFYQPDGQGNLERTSDYLALEPAAAADRITRPTLVVGDGVALYGEVFRQRAGDNARLVLPSLHQPRAAAIGVLALRCLARGEDGLPEATPLYVRPPDARLPGG